MKKALLSGLIFGFICGISSSSAAGRWDGAFNFEVKSTQDGGDQVMTVPTGAYLKCRCTQDAYLNTGQHLSDGGVTTSLCLLPDAGYGCDKVAFSTNGEVWYSQLRTTDDRVVSNAASGTCACFSSH